MFEILSVIASPIIKSVAMQNIIASNILKVPPICSNTLTIFLSDKVSAIAADSVYNPVSTVNFIIGVIHIPITTIIPTIPMAFLQNLLKLFLQLAQMCLWQF